MPGYTNTCPMPRSAVIDTYFMEHRAKVLDIAAFLDRVERSSDDGGGDAATTGGGGDFRLTALREAIRILADDQPHRAKRILEIFSDPTLEPLESAAGLKGAAGAWPKGIPGRDGNPTLGTDF